MAIAFNAASNSAEVTGTNTVSWAHVCTGSNLILVVGIAVRDGTAGDRPVTGITYNSVALTKIRSDDNGSTASSELWYLLNPSTGSNTVTATTTGTCDGIGGGAISITGAKQSGQPDGSNGSSSTGATSGSANITTVANNCFIIDVLRTSTAVSDETPAGTQVQKCNINGAQLRMRMSIQGPLTPAGAKTDSWSWGGGAAYALTSASFSPSSSGSFLAFM